MSSFSTEVSQNRFSTVDSNHHGGILWITSSLSLTYFSLSCILRMYLSYRHFTKDATSLLVATVFGFVHNGYAADILFIVALAISKLSVVYFVARLTPHVKYVKLCTVASALCVAWGIGGVFALALRCNLAKPWITIGERCTNILLRWQIISAFDVILEVAILALVFGLVFNLQMPFWKKFTVVLGFAFRLPLIVLAIVHVQYVESSITSTNATFDQITPSVIMSIQLGWSLISATIPCLKSFVVYLGSGYLGATLNTNLGSYAISDERSGVRSDGRNALREGSYPLSKISVSRPQETTVTGGRGRGSDRHGQNDVASTSVHSVNRTSNDGSQDFIIRRTVDYRISYEDNENTR
ncbi:hypothetical protein V495_01269 [Pseudogymnoascus sp. VKM F-4514 (FW-929)]|nr:hypothetical protein V495_01269 [Pseudogymnoascus sp. VKM F-4514 (FW-929)]